MKKFIGIVIFTLLAFLSGYGATWNMVANPASISANYLVTPNSVYSFTNVIYAAYEDQTYQQLVIRECTNGSSWFNVGYYPTVSSGPATAVKLVYPYVSYIDKSLGNSIFVKYATNTNVFWYGFTNAYTNTYSNITTVLGSGISYYTNSYSNVTLVGTSTGTISNYFTNLSAYATNYFTWVFTNLTGTYSFPITDVTYSSIGVITDFNLTDTVILNSVILTNIFGNVTNTITNIDNVSGTIIASVPVMTIQTNTNVITNYVGYLTNITTNYTQAISLTNFTENFLGYTFNISNYIGLAMTNILTNGFLATNGVFTNAVTDIFTQYLSFTSNWNFITNGSYGSSLDPNAIGSYTDKYIVTGYVVDPVLTNVFNWVPLTTLAPYGATTLDMSVYNSITNPVVIYSDPVLNRVKYAFISNATTGAWYQNESSTSDFSQSASRYIALGGTDFSNIFIGYTPIAPLSRFVLQNFMSTNKVTNFINTTSYTGYVTGLKFSGTTPYTLVQSDVSQMLTLYAWSTNAISSYLTNTNGVVSTNIVYKWLPPTYSHLGYITNIATNIVTYTVPITNTNFSYIPVGGNAFYGPVAQSALAMDTNGTTFYVAVLDKSYNGKVSVMCYTNGGSWFRLGGAYLSTGVVNNLNITVDKGSDVPTVSFSDAYGGGAVRVWLWK